MTQDRTPNPSDDEQQDELTNDSGEPTEQADPADRDAAIRASEAESSAEPDDTSIEEPGTETVEDLAESPTGVFADIPHEEDADPVTIEDVKGSQAESSVDPDTDVLDEREEATFTAAGVDDSIESSGLTDEDETIDPEVPTVEELDPVLDDQSEPVEAVEAESEAERAVPDDSETAEGVAAGQPAFAARAARLASVSEDPGPTTCPVCHNRTAAVRFCSHCGIPLTEQRSRPPVEPSNPVQRVIAQGRARLNIEQPWSFAGTDATIVGIGLVLVLLAALANSGGLALVAASLILPVLVVWKLMERNVQDPESPLIILGIGAAGLLVGLVLRWGAAWLTSSQWFETGRLNFGALGFGGPFAQQAGGAPFSVWFVNGLLLPILVIAGIVAGGIALQRWQQSRVEVMDGVTLAGAAAAGFVIGAVFVFVTPMIATPGPQMSVSDWTLLTVGTTVLYPLAVTLAGATLGAGVWRYMLNADLSTLLVPALGALAGLLLLPLGSILFQPVGMWAEFIWVLVITIVVAVVFQRVLSAALTHDRAMLGNDRRRVICPHCRRVTALGTYCAHCGMELPADEELQDAAAT